MRRILIILLLACMGATSHAQLLALKSNLLMDAATISNVGMEIATNERTSVALNGFKSWKIYGTPANIYGITPEFRYWINGRPFTRFYTGAGLTVAHYNIETNKHDFVGSAFGGGLDFGYVVYLTPHLSVDFQTGIGVYRYHHNRSDASEEKEPVLKYNIKKCTLLPYQLGINLVYIIK